MRRGLGAHPLGGFTLVELIRAITDPCGNAYRRLNIGISTTGAGCDDIVRCADGAFVGVAEDY